MADSSGDWSLPALLGAYGLSSAASLYNNRQNIKYAKQANKLAVYLADTAHQREVNDLRAAGLNPILSAQGSGASVPQLKTPQLEAIDGTIGHNARSVAEAVNGQMSAESRMMQADASSAMSAARVARREEYLDQQRAMLEDIDNSARLQALLGDPDKDKDVQVISGDRGMRANFGGEGSTKAYDDLVSKYRRDLWNGAYQSNPVHTIWDDVDRGLNTAQQVEDLVLGWKKGFGKPQEHFKRSQSFIKDGVRHYYERSR